MTKKTIKARVDDLEQASPEQPQILACESILNPGIYTVSEIGEPDTKERLTWPEVLARYEGRQIIRFYHVEDRRPSDD